MDDVWLLAFILLYVILVLGFVAAISRDPAAWADQPRRATVWVVAGFVVTGPLGALFVLVLARHRRRADRLMPPPDL